MVVVVVSVELQLERDATTSRAETARKAEGIIGTSGGMRVTASLQARLEVEALRSNVAECHTNGRVAAVTDYTSVAFFICHSRRESSLHWHLPFFLSSSQGICFFALVIHRPVMATAFILICHPERSEGPASQPPPKILSSPQNGG